jgi:hypothetical protein
LKLHVVGAPFERIATDIAGPYPLTEKGNRYILVVADYFSKLTEIYPIQDILIKRDSMKAFYFKNFVSC